MTRRPSEPGPDLMVFNATLATPEGLRPLIGPPRLRRVDRAWLLARGGLVDAIGSGDPPLVPSTVERLDAEGGALLPGLVDCHTHAAFAGSRVEELGRRLAGATYAEIAAAGGGILSTVATTRRASQEELTGALVRRLDAMLATGTTTAEVKSGYGLDRDTELRQLRAIRDADALHPVDVVATFLGAHSVPQEHRADRAAYLGLVESVLEDVAAEGLAEFCDVFCEEGVFTVAEARRLLQRARSLGLGVKVHADELAPSGAAELAAELGAVSAEHLMKASDAGLAALGRAGVVAVLLPGTSLFLREEPASAERFRVAGCAMAIATDFNPGTCPVGNLPLVGALACLRNGLSPDEMLVAVTLNAAAAIGRSARIGSLEPGKAADAVVLAGAGHEEIVYRLGLDVVRHVVKAGRVVVRDGERVP